LNVFLAQHTTRPGLREPRQRPPVHRRTANRASAATGDGVMLARLLPSPPYPHLTDRTTTCWADLRSVIRDGERSGLHVEHGEVDPDLWCCAVGLEPGARGELLALAVISFGEPSATQRPRIFKALRRESRDVSYALA